jgi:hypothetical protein
MDKRANNGGHSTKPQRPDDKRLMTKTELQDAYESLKPFHPEALRQLEMAMKEGEKWAVELWFKYFFRMPTQTIDQNNNHNFNGFELKEILSFDNSKREI